MQNPTILYPIFALAGWTAVVQGLIPFARVQAARRGEVVVDDFKFGEAARVPVAVSIPNRNYMNLLEFPVLFYVVCLMLYTAQGASILLVNLAWAYVILRVLHSAIHLTYNRVTHRIAAFALSNFVLVTLWILAATQVIFNASA